MKQLLFALFLGLSVSMVAQDKDANTFKNEGNESWKNKDYKGAYEAWAQALSLLDAEGTVDDALIYNTGYAAFKADKYKEAIPYFTKAIELSYKDSKPYAFLAQVHMKMDDLDAMEKTLIKGLAKYNADKTLKKLAAHCYLRKGLEFYNVGNDIKSAANNSGLNETDPEAFKAEYARADEEFKKALPYMEKSYEYDASNDKALKALQNIYTNLEMTDKANEIQTKLDAM
ncbi:MAG: tetratricopeptide repeat protein [Salinivirgaceae bacterium]